MKEPDDGIFFSFTYRLCVHVCHVPHVLTPGAFTPFVLDVCTPHMHYLRAVLVPFTLFSLILRSCLLHTGLITATHHVLHPAIVPRSLGAVLISCFTYRAVSRMVINTWYLTR